MMSLLGLGINKIDAYYIYVEITSELARSKGAQFGLNTMVLGLILLLLSVVIHLNTLTSIENIMVICSKE
jgi:hypothetical protein